MSDWLIPLGLSIGWILVLVSSFNWPVLMKWLKQLNKWHEKPMYKVEVFSQNSCDWVSYGRRSVFLGLDERALGENDRTTRFTAREATRFVKQKERSAPYKMFRIVQLTEGVTKAQYRQQKLDKARRVAREYNDAYTRYLERELSNLKETEDE